jgi:hypothetical protein
MKHKAPRCGIGSEFGFGHLGGYQISLEQRKRGDRFQRALPLANGRAALGVAVRYARLTMAKQRTTVLLPAYLCQSMIQPIVELGLRVRFYPVGPDLSVKPAEVCERIDDSILAVLLMHYFGFPQAEDLAAVLKARFPHIVIIDDRTHLLLSDLRSETISSDVDVATYSARKWGPFPDLGLVIWRGGDPEAKHGGLLDRGYDFSFGFLRLLGVLLRTLFFAWPSETGRRLSLMPFHKADAVLDHRVRIRGASPLSRLLWRFWDWEGASQVRRENYQYLLDNWPSGGIEPLFKKLPESVCPLGFPIRTPERNRVRQHLISKGLFAPIHWLRPPQISARDFPDAADLAEEELTIPIDQRYGLAQMDYILEVLCHV